MNETVVFGIIISAIVIGLFAVAFSDVGQLVIESFRSLGWIGLILFIVVLMAFIGLGIVYYIVIVGIMIFIMALIFPSD
jgi:hypothetical protein